MKIFLKTHFFCLLGEIEKTNIVKIIDNTTFNNPKVSVTMITYNHEEFIGRAIEGVLMQITDFEVEFIIGEDCSSDFTRRIVCEFQKKHST